MKLSSSLNGRALLSLLLLSSLLGGCISNAAREPEPAPKESQESPAPPPVVVQPVVSDKGQPELLSGIGQYENGNYKLATRQLQSALALGLESSANQARAHKYLAFIHCVGGRQSQCREEFRKALEADPTFSLTPAEAGHPTWGPVFRKLKSAGRSGKK